MKSKLWMIGWAAVTIGTLGLVGGKVYAIDPFFHYHKPQLDKYFYVINNQRSQNNGICKNFEYDALITGTSMTENFKTSQMDDLFGTRSIKVPFSGGTYKEINDNLKVALEHNPDLKIIVRGLDMGYFFNESDAMRKDLGAYPTYLYDKNPFNDVQYLFNRDVVFSRVYPMTKSNNVEGFAAGITSFDKYSNWQNYYKFGIKTVNPLGFTIRKPDTEMHLTEEEKSIIQKNIDLNVTSLAEQYPDVTFYYFIPPYSAVWWNELVNSGRIYKQIEAEQYIIELILECENIKLFSFNNRTDIVIDLNHYKDVTHYGEWINSLMLQWMHDEKYMLTKENYKDYLKQELQFYTNFNYEQLNEQEDYENDFYAAALLNQELNKVDPKEVFVNIDALDLSNASIVDEQYNGMPGILCQGRLRRPSEDVISISEYLMNIEYIGAKVTLDHVDSYRYLVFYGKKNALHGQPSVYLYNENNEKVAEFTKNYAELDEEWHQYIIDISEFKGKMTVIFNGGYIDQTGDQNSSYVFSNAYLY